MSIIHTYKRLASSSFPAFSGLFIFCYGMGRVGKIKTIDLAARGKIKGGHSKKDKIKK